MSELSRSILVARNTTHGMSHLPEYSNWKDMKKRCFNPNNKRYKDYAKRGISVHNDFVESFPLWLEEIGPKPDTEQRWSVGRIDNNGWYTYGNMRWELDTQQARNHSKQDNNKSGVVGVHIRTTRIAGVEYKAWIAKWNLLDGTTKTKSFSFNKFGEQNAKCLAIECRSAKMKELNEMGADYADSHGSVK